MHQGFVFRDIVQCAEMHLQHVLQLVPLWRGEDDASSHAIEHLGAIKVHAPVGGVWSRRQVLVLSPIGKEVSYDLGLDRRSGLVLDGVSCKLNRPFGHPAGCILAPYDL
jgi:hypothetical protein